MKPGTPSETHAPVRKKNGFVDALVISNPDLSLFLKLQNLLNYFVECLSQIAASQNKEQCVEHFHLCIDHLTFISKSKSDGFNPEIRRLLKEFLEDAAIFESLLKVLSPQNESDTDIPLKHADILIPAKASNLHWLAVCILEELKKPFSRS